MDDGYATLRSVWTRMGAGLNPLCANLTGAGYSEGLMGRNRTRAP